jgi:RND superfamily putative drug exporter
MGPATSDGRLLVEPQDDPPPPTGLFERYAAWAVRRRWHIVVAWLLALGGLVALPPVGSGGNELASIIPLDSPALSSELRALDEFGFPLSSRVAVVQRDPDGLSPFVQAESVLDALAVNQGPKPGWPLLGALPLSNSLRLFGATGETNTSVLTYLFMDPVSSFASQQEAAERYVTAHLERPEDHVVGVAGSVPARAQQAQLVSDNLHRLELLTVLAILVLVGLTFRSVVAPAIALIASGISFVATISLSEVLSGLAGISTPAELEPLLVALLLGVVTDYTIFYITALQGRIGVTPQWRHAVRDAVRSDTPIVAAAGVTVAAGTAALLAADSEFFRAFGPAMALAVLVGLVVSVTFVPAALAVLGPAVFWPSDPHRPRWRASAASTTRAPRGTPNWTPQAGRRGTQRVRLVRLLATRSAAAAVVAGCVGVLLIAAAPVRDLDLGVGFSSSLPPDNPVALASDAAATAFAPGITSPTTLLVERAGVVEDVDRLVDLQHLVEREPGVAGVIGPAQNVTQRAFNVVLSRSGDAARMLIVLGHDPLAATAWPLHLAVRSTVTCDVRVELAGSELCQRCQRALAVGREHRLVRHHTGRVVLDLPARSEVVDGALQRFEVRPVRHEGVASGLERPEMLLAARSTECRHDGR